MEDVGKKSFLLHCEIFLRHYATNAIYLRYYIKTTKS